MLKALELHGFKSFADKTRFEFPHGVTVVVGPNGSGKSNVVDGIRWVLGEQSAKSLRGAEMADVIFKGSGTGQRKPANTAEVTIVFDNEPKRLDIDASEVRVTRRVYRSGEGEYLINGEPCRLRDVRDLFRGTGVGTDAYSLIEQGKVDTLLQASPRERRAIFEEAAGISRFKAKKVESQRRLDRVQQNLLRLRDIVEEVDRRLRSLRNQATKAQRYKEHNDRLKELRTQLGWSDYHDISQQCSLLQVQWDGTVEQWTESQSALQESEQELGALDQRLAEIQVAARRSGQQYANNRETIASHETSMKLGRMSLLELDEEERGCRTRLWSVNTRVGDVQLQLQQIREQLAAEEARREELLAAVEENETQMTSLLDKLRHDERLLQQKRSQHAEQLQATEQLSRQLSRFESELSLAAVAIERDRARCSELQRQWEDCQRQSCELDTQEAERRAALDHATQQQDAAQVELDTRATTLTQAEQAWRACQQELTAATERSRVLEEVERRLEGIGAGTKQLLEQAKANPHGPLGEIRGMVADLVEVKVEMAPLIDAALGPYAQFIVVTGHRLLHAIAAGSVRLAGRVGLLSLQDVGSADPARRGRPIQHSSVLGPAIDFVQVDNQWRDLTQHLLGQTWFVRTLEDALRLRTLHVGEDVVPRFVTAAGEVVEHDGSVHVGPRAGSGGIVSRRSELRALRTQIQQRSTDAGVLEQRATKAREALTITEQSLSHWISVRKEASDAYAEIHANAEATRQLARQTQLNYESLRNGLTELELRQSDLAGQQDSALVGLEELEQLLATLTSELTKHHSQLAELEHCRKAKELETTTSRIEFAKVEQRVETLRVQANRSEQDHRERARGVADLRGQLEHCQKRRSDVTLSVLRATSAIAELQLEQQQLSQQLRNFRKQERDIAARREALRSDARRMRDLTSHWQEEKGKLDLQLNELRLKQNGVAERIREDYGVDLATLQDSQIKIADVGDREAIDEEIRDLRRKLSNIGAVNMESVEELGELEERFGALSSQYDDLVSAKESLERIIQRINADSRRMFTETLDAIRGSFQLLFRKAFGGGHADIVVEEAEDPLDGGIEVVATPPGKQSLSISLLSGGERALTAVTLLLAIFRHRPSPFCILDEVDGPLDEANIGRFVGVLQEFLDHTKVVIVTHSKKTMSAATTLYGVTMQESGVSKRVSVQFSDVREDGTIRAIREDGDGDGEAA